MKFIGRAKLDEMKMMSRGNPQKIAQYEIAEGEYKALISQYFDEETPYANIPAEHYVRRLEEKASETGDEADRIRAKMIREVYDYRQFSRNDAQKIDNTTKNELQRKLYGGEKLTTADLLAAEKYARKFSSPDNLAMYSQIKRAVEAAEIE